LKVIFPSGRDPAIVLKPSEKTLDLPSFAISPKWSTILGFGSHSVPFVRGDHLDSTGSEFSVQRVTVISPVADNPIRKLRKKTTLKGSPYQFHFMRRSAGHVEGVRKTRSVCNCHDLGPFPPLSWSNAGAPFLAGAKVPSMKASWMSIPPRLRRSSARAMRIFSKTPSFDHFWCQRWQVDLDGYRDGRSCHCAPVRRIQRIPFKTDRGSIRSLPRGSDRFIGISGSITAHCSFVKSILLYLITFSQKSRFYWDRL
jgi:hypothetical protein